MFNLEFKNENGNMNKGDIKIFALSTCAFCKKALKFMRDNSIKFSFVYIDELDSNTKQVIKTDLKEKFNQDVGFPFLILNDTSVIVGFKEEEYKKLFL